MRLASPFGISQAAKLTGGELILRLKLPALNKHLPLTTPLPLRCHTLFLVSYRPAHRSRIWPVEERTLPSRRVEGSLAAHNLCRPPLPSLFNHCYGLQLVQRGEHRPSLDDSYRLLLHRPGIQPDHRGAFLYPERLQMGLPCAGMGLKLGQPLGINLGDCSQAASLWRSK